MRGSRKTSCDGLPSQPKRQYLLNFTNDPIIIIWFNLKLNLGRTQKIEEKKSSQKTFYFNFFCVIIEMLWCRGWWCYHLYQLHTSLRGSITRGILDAFNKMLLRYFYRLLFTLRKAKNQRKDHWHFTVKFRIFFFSPRLGIYSGLHLVWSSH